MRMVGRHGERVPFVNEARLRRRLEENEIPVAAIDPGLFAGPVEDRSAWMNELSSFAETLDFCRRIACSRVIVSGFASPVERQPEAAEALRRAADLAARAGVRLIVFHAGETCAPDAVALASLLALPVAVPAATHEWVAGQDVVGHDRFVRTRSGPACTTCRMRWKSSRRRCGRSLPVSARTVSTSTGSA